MTRKHSKPYAKVYQNIQSNGIEKVPISDIWNVINQKIAFNSRVASALRTHTVMLSVPAENNEITVRQIKKGFTF